MCEAYELALWQKVLFKTRCTYILCHHALSLVICFAQNATAPASGDTLLIYFNVPVQTPPVATQSDVNRLIVFSPPIRNVTYTGRLVVVSSAQITGSGARNLGACYFCGCSSTGCENFPRHAKVPFKAGRNYYSDVNAWFRVLSTFTVGSAGFSLRYTLTT